MENVDPSTMAATVQEARNWAELLRQSPEAATNLANLLRVKSPDHFPKEALEMLIFKTLEALCNFQGLRLEQARGSEYLGVLFSILHKLAGISRQVRASIVGFAQSAPGVFDQLMAITIMALQIRPIFVRSLAFLNLLVRDEGSEHSRRVMAVIGPNKDLFSLVFAHMVNTHHSTVIEFVARLLRCGDRRAYREKLKEQKVQLLLAGVDRHEGLLLRSMRKNQPTQVHNTLKILELLVRNDPPPQLPQEEAIQKWFIDNNVFHFLEKCLETGNPKFIETSLIIYANLASCPHIRDDMAARVIQIMLSQTCLKLTELKLQNAIIHVIYNLSRKRIELQHSLAGSQTLNYACHLIKSYANRAQISCGDNHHMLETALDLCLRQLQLTLPPELATPLWTEGGEHAHLAELFFDAPFVSCLINMLVTGATNDRIKTRAVQVMVAGLSLPVNRFGPILFSSFAETSGENISAALINAISTPMTASGTLTPATAAFIRAAADLLPHLAKDANMLTCVAAFARSNTTHFPLNVVFCPAFDGDHNLLKKLLPVCKTLIEYEPELQQSWSLYRDRFATLAQSGIYEINQLATEISNLLMLAIDGDSNDFGQAFMNTLI